MTPFLDFASAAAASSPVVHEFTGTMTSLQLLVALLIGIAPVAATVGIKLWLHRCRVAEDDARRQRTGRAFPAAGIEFDRSLRDEDAVAGERA